MAKKKAKKPAKKVTVKKKADKKKAAKKKSSRRDDDDGETDSDAVEAARLYPPKGGATVRFYRIGHGDCFLIAFASDSPDKPVYVLIDCGYKPGSPGYLKQPTKSAEIWKNIHAATGGHIDVTVITHEHQDHVNGISEKNLGDITIGETWLAWTEDPKDDLANRLRKDYKDKLIGLAAARNRLETAGDQEQVCRVDGFLEFELGGDDDEPFGFAAVAQALAAGDGESKNKKSMLLFKERAGDVKFIRPHQRILRLPGAKDVRVYALGPPRDEDLLKDMDPQGDEAFPDNALATASPSNFFAAAAKATANKPVQPLFADRYTVALSSASTHGEVGNFFQQHYGVNAAGTATLTVTSSDDDRAPDDASWRRIDHDWLASAGQLALALNSYTNNTSLVLAFELGSGGKVLLFAADAQRGNWISWADKDWKDGDNTMTVKDLLSRTVLYKVGHHCSHNATLNGVERDNYANIGWMATGEHSNEFAAMITAVWAWAQTQKGWYHPYPPIKEALLKKASGRVFQTDTNYDEMKKPDEASEMAWERFEKATNVDRLYFDYSVLP